MPATPARPRGYVGQNHETLGSDILAVLATLRSAAEVLGAERASSLLSLDPQGWYPIATLLDLLGHLQSRVGRASLVKMGRQLFNDSHQKRVGPVISSAGDVIFGIDGWYHHANRGEGIGGWKVLRFGAGVAFLEKTTPHLCALEEGILLEALHLVHTDSLIVQPRCLQQGADACVFEIHSAIRDGRWTGRHANVA